MSDYPYDLGSYSRPITTESADAQLWWDRGLNWLFGYNHEEAMVCFEHALEADPNCAMAYWGLAYAFGPNYNFFWDFFDPEDRLPETLVKTRDWLGMAEGCPKSEVEAAMISALWKRYPQTEIADVPTLYGWSNDFADAMREVHANFSGDEEVAMIFVEAMMNRTPWNMWDPRTGDPVEDANTLESKQILETAISENEAAGRPLHPGLLHLYVHLMEMSATPEAALLAADGLRGLVPAAGHLEHMATHIDVLCGNYYDVVVGNSAGIAADLQYWELNGALNFYSMYRVHNYHFKLYGAMFLGQYGAAMAAVDSMLETIPDELVAMEPFPNMIESYLSMKTHALVRFGKWQELIDEPLPENQELFSVTTTLAWYGKGVAHAALKQHEEAAAAVAAFEAAAATVPEERNLHVVSCLDIIAVAREMLSGEVQYHLGNYDVAFDHLRAAVALEDALPYDEPWGWMMPSRHALGALLLEQGHLEEAAAAFEADLGLDDSVIRSNQHPDNVWALVGLHDCYVQMGKNVEARVIEPRMQFALSRADDTIQRSCFCSMSTGSA